MLLTIDAGNTNTVFAIYDGDTLKCQWRIGSDAKRTADEYAVWLLQLMALKGIDPAAIDRAIAACVIPYALHDLKTLCRQYFNTELRVIGEVGVATGIAAEVDPNTEVGADRLVNAYAVWKKFAMPVVVVDFGTATTFDIINERGAYIGGVIAPGVNLSLDALQKAAAKLPNIAIHRPEKVIGRNTIAAMQSGIYYGYVGLIEGIVARIREEVGKTMKVVATGGLAPLYAKAATAIESVEPDLTIWGLKEIDKLNRGIGEGI